jgi:hypothetical protein
MSDSSNSNLYNVILGFIFLVLGWLWQRDAALELQIHQLEERLKNEITVKASDRWTGLQQVEYRQIIDERDRALDDRIKHLETTATRCKD